MSLVSTATARSEKRSSAARIFSSASVVFRRRLTCFLPTAPVVLAPPPMWRSWVTGDCVPQCTAAGGDDAASSARGLALPRLPPHARAAFSLSQPASQSHTSARSDSMSLPLHAHSLHAFGRFAINLQVVRRKRRATAVPGFAEKRRRTWRAAWERRGSDHAE